MPHHRYVPKSTGEQKRQHYLSQKRKNSVFCILNYTFLYKHILVYFTTPRMILTSVALCTQTYRSVVQHKLLAELIALNIWMCNQSSGKLQSQNWMHEILRKLLKPSQKEALNQGYFTLLIGTDIKGAGTLCAHVIKRLWRSHLCEEQVW